MNIHVNDTSNMIYTCYHNLPCIYIIIHINWNSSMFVLYYRCIDIGTDTGTDIEIDIDICIDIGIDIHCRYRYRYTL